MKFFSFEKDGGALSKVWGLFFVEIKKAFSVVLLHFEDGSCEAFHSHAFNSVSWVLKGSLMEDQIPTKKTFFAPSWKPVITTRQNLHKVTSMGNTYVLSFRGPWQAHWIEYLPESNEIVELTHGRVEESRTKVPFPVLA